MGHVVDEKALFSDMEKMGVKIRTEMVNAPADQQDKFSRRKNPVADLRRSGIVVAA